jgi:hypothetical protein
LSPASGLLEAAKRIVFKNKMIRLHRRDGLKVLRLRRNGLTGRSGFPDEDSSLAPRALKRWILQDKQKLVEPRGQFFLKKARLHLRTYFRR